MPNGASPHEVGEVRIVAANVGDAARSGFVSYRWIENDPDRLRRLYIAKAQETAKLNRFLALPKAVTPIDSAGRFSCGAFEPGTYDPLALTDTPERTTGPRRRFGADTLITNFSVTKIRVPKVASHAPVVVIVPHVFRNSVHLDPEHPPSDGAASPST